MTAAKRDANDWYSKGVALDEQGCHQEALLAFEEAIRLDLNYPVPWNGKGNALYDLGRHQEALSAYEEAIRLDPNRPFPWNGKGRVLFRLGLSLPKTSSASNSNKLRQVTLGCQSATPHPSQHTFNVKTLS